MDLTIDEITKIGFLYEKVKYIKEGSARKIVSRKNPEKSVNWKELKKFCVKAQDGEWLPAFYFAAQYTGKRLPVKPELKLLNNKVAVSKYVKFIKDNKPKLYNSTKDMVLDLQKSYYSLFLYMRANDLKNFDELITFKTFKNQVYPDLHRIFRLGLLSSYMVGTSETIFGALKNINLIEKNYDNYKFLLKSNKKAYEIYNQLNKKLLR